MALRKSFASRLLGIARVAHQLVSSSNSISIGCKRAKWDASFKQTQAQAFPAKGNVKPTHDNDVATPAKVKKGLTSPQITLILPDEMVQSTNIETAEKLAKRRNLKLVKILDFDSKTERPLYQLMSNLEFFKAEVHSKEERKKERNKVSKDDKLFLVSTKISEHDMFVKINQVIKLLKKNHNIRLYISQGGDPKKAGELVEIVKEKLKEYATLKNQVKATNVIKLYFNPNVVTKDETSTEVHLSEDKVVEKKKKEENVEC